MRCIQELSETIFFTCFPWSPMVLNCVICINFLSFFFSLSTIVITIIVIIIIRLHFSALYYISVYIRCIAVRIKFQIYCILRRVHGDWRRRGSSSRRRVSRAPASVSATAREKDGEATRTRQETRHSNVVRIRQTYSRDKSIAFSRLVVNNRHSASVAVQAALKLHWLDVRDRVTFKLVVTVHRCLNGWTPQYLVVQCVTLSSQIHLRSAERNLLHVPRYRLNTYGRRDFAVAGPSAWNSLPDPVRNPNST